MVSVDIGKFKWSKPMFGLISVALCFFFAEELHAQRKLQEMDPERSAQQEQQNEEKKNKSAFRLRMTDRISYGGNLGGAFGNLGSQLSLQPMLFYRITDKTMAGTGITYYYQSRVYGSGATKQTISANAWGGNFFARHELFEGALLYTEYMPLNFRLYNPTTRNSERQWVGAFLVGGGMNQRNSERSGMYFLVLYDVLHSDSRSLSPQPIHLRTGFYF